MPSARDSEAQRRRGSHPHGGGNRSEHRGKRKTSGLPGQRSQSQEKSGFGKRREGHLAAGAHRFKARAGIERSKDREEPSQRQKICGHYEVARERRKCRKSSERK